MDKRFLDLVGLKDYTDRLKKFIKNKDNEILSYTNERLYNDAGYGKYIPTSAHIIGYKNKLDSSEITIEEYDNLSPEDKKLYEPVYDTPIITINKALSNLENALGLDPGTEDVPSVSKKIQEEAKDATYKQQGEEIVTIGEAISNIEEVVNNEISPSYVQELFNS